MKNNNDFNIDEKKQKLEISMNQVENYLEPGYPSKKPYPEPQIPEISSSPSPEYKTPLSEAIGSEEGEEGSKHKCESKRG